MTAPDVDRLESLEEKIRAADSAGDLATAFSARNELVTAAMMSGRSEKALPAFAWCLARSESAPGAGPVRTFELLWKYKWVAHSLPQFPDVTLERIEALLADMAERYRDWVQIFWIDDSPLRIN